MSARTGDQAHASTATTVDARPHTRRRPTSSLRSSGGARGLRPLLALALVAALLGSAACSDDDGGSTPDSAVGDDGDGPTSGSLELEPSTTTTTTPQDQALSTVLVEDLPVPGFERADDALNAGILDLDAAAAAETDVAAERALLSAEGFERGASRAWVGPGQDVVYLAVYEFETAEGASAYLAEGAEKLVSRGATTFEVLELEGATGFTTVEESPEGDFTAHAVSFTQGRRWVLALVGSPASTRTPDDARSVAIAQGARLG